MNQSFRMGKEVSQISHKICKVVLCATCAIGIAVDIVGQRWGEPEYDWAGTRFGHECTLTHDGLTADQQRDVRAIQSDLSRAPRPAVQQDFDARLPPEADDDRPPETTT